MNCGQNRALLARHLLGDLEGPEGDAVSRHLEACGDCRRVAEELAPALSALRESLAATRAAPSRLSAERRRAVLETAPSAVLSWEWIARPYRSLAAAAAVLVACGFVALLIRHLESTPFGNERRDVVIRAGSDKSRIAASLARAKPGHAGAPGGAIPGDFDGASREVSSAPVGGLAEKKKGAGANEVSGGLEVGENMDVDLASAFAPAKPAREVERPAPVPASAAAADYLATSPKTAERRDEAVTPQASHGKDSVGRFPRNRRERLGEPSLPERSTETLSETYDSAKAKMASGQVGGAGPMLNVEVEGSVSPADAGRRLIRVRVIGDPGRGRVVVVARRGAIWRVEGALDKDRKGISPRQGGAGGQSAWFEIQVDPKMPDSELLAEVCLRSGTGDRVLHRILAGDVAPPFESVSAGFREEAAGLAGGMAPAGARMPILSKAAMEADVTAEPPDPAPMNDALDVPAGVR